MDDVLDDGIPLEVVQLDALVVMKIIKHCTDSFPELVTGQLLGLDVERRLEVTNCFSFPQDKDDDDSKAGAKYQIQMMKNLREINVDNNAVGWYQSTYFGSYLSQSMIDSQYNYQTNIPKSVVIVYDPLKANQGVMSLRAFRLNKLFMELYRDKKFTPEMLKKANLNRGNIFEEVPIEIHNSHLANALIYELDVKKEIEVYEQLELTNDPYLEKNLEYMLGLVEEMTMEQNKLQQYHRAVARQSMQQNSYLQKQKLEKGEAAANEEDLNQNPLFKFIPEPSRLEGLLVSNQIENYCKQINQFAGQSFSKLFLTEGIFDRS